MTVDNPEVDMARRTIRAATSIVLMPVLLLQTACYRALGPPEPVHPTDSDQVKTLQDAYRVDVVLIDGSTQQLRHIVMREHRLHGFNDEAHQETSFPFDSIQSVQAYADDTNKNFAIATVLVGVVGVLVLANNLRCLFCWDWGEAQSP